MKTFEYYYRVTVQAKTREEANDILKKRMTKDIKSNEPNELGYIYEIPNKFTLTRKGDKE